MVAQVGHGGGAVVPLADPAVEDMPAADDAAGGQAQQEGGQDQPADRA